MLSVPKQAVWTGALPHDELDELKPEKIWFSGAWRFVYKEDSPFVPGSQSPETFGIELRKKGPLLEWSTVSWVFSLVVYTGVISEGRSTLVSSLQRKFFISLMPRHVLDTTTMKVLISRTGKLRLPRVSNTNCEEHSFLFLSVGRQTVPRHTAQSKGTWIGSGFILSCGGLDNLFGEYLPIEKLRVNVDKDDTQNLTVSKWQSFCSALNLVGFKEH